MILETDWLLSLQNAKRWDPFPRRIVVLSPHPDDEILGAGGFLAAQTKRGIPITVLAATDGEAAYPEVQDLAEVRRQEQENALRMVGIFSDDIQRLRLPDGRVSDHEASLSSWTAKFLDDASLLLAPWEFDPHPDHESCGRAAASAAATTGALHVSYFFWAWHSSTPSTLTDLPLRRFELNTELQILKYRALAEYRSQLHREVGEPILPESLLAPARRSFETFALRNHAS